MNFSIVNILFLSIFIGFIADNPEVDYLQIIPGTVEKVEMIYLPGGTFTMGSPKSEKNHFGDEGPQHEIEIAPFWIGKYEITWDIYELFIAREIDSKKPIGNGIITCLNMKQAIIRKKKGAEAANAILSVLSQK